MKLYHGSNIPIEKVDLSKGRPYKDFGQGFYLTDILPQAERMASRITRLFKGTPCVTAFEFSLEEAKDRGLKIKIFDGPSDEWAEFVMKNRDLNTPQPCHDFDIVIGPVANDTIARLLRMYLENFIDKPQLLKELTFAQPTSQYFFHTEAAVALLKRL